MKLSAFTYILSILFFAGIPLIIKLRHDKKILSRYEKVLITMAILSFIFTPLDYLAHIWNAWQYGTFSTFNIRIGAELETYIFSVFIGVALAAATLTGAYYQDRLRARSKTKKRANTRRKKAKLIYSVR